MTLHHTRLKYESNVFCVLLDSVSENKVNNSDESVKLRAASKSRDQSSGDDNRYPGDS